MPSAAEVLAAKRAAIDRLTSTVAKDAIYPTAHGQAWHVDTPPPLPAYPAPGATRIEIASFKVPSGMTAVLNTLAIVHVGASGSFIDGSGKVIWRVLLNGAGINGLEALYSQIGQLSQPQMMSLMLAANDRISVTAEIPAGQVAPAGNPAARIAGFLNVGGQSAQLPATTGSASSSNSDSSTSSTTSAPVVSAPSAPIYSSSTYRAIQPGGCWMYQPWPTRISVLGDHRYRFRTAPQRDWIRLTAADGRTVDCTPGQRWLTRRGLIAAKDMRVGDIQTMTDGEIAIVKIQPFQLNGTRIEVEDLEASARHAGRLVNANGFIGHNRKIQLERSSE